MKRSLSAVAVGLFLLVPAIASAQEVPTLRLGVMVDQLYPDQAELFTAMMAEISAVVGSDAVIVGREEDAQVIEFDLERARTVYDSLVAADVDVILAFGPVSLAGISGRSEYPKPTIASGAVNLDLFEVPEPGETSGVSNFTLVVSSASYEQDLRTFQSLYDFHNLGVVMPAGLTSVLPVEDKIFEITEGLGVNFEVISYASPEDLRPALDRVDAVYVAESFFIPSDDILVIADMLKERRIPSFSAARREDVVAGLMATNQAEESLDVFFRRIALLIETIVHGEDLSEQQVLVEQSQTLTVNYHTAQTVGVPIRYSLISTTEFVGDFENPLAERRYALLDLVDEVIAVNLGLESDRRAVRLAEQDAKASWSTYLPSVSATVTQSVVDQDVAAISQGQNPQYATDGSLAVDQLVFSPDVNANISVQRSLEEAQHQRLLASEWDAVLEAANAYFTALILKANVQIQVRNLESTKRNIRIAEQALEAGQAGRGDVLRLRSEAARQMQSLIEAVTRVEQAFHAINQIVNQPINREIDVEDMALQNGTFSDEDFERFRTILDDPSLRDVFEDWVVQEALSVAPELRIFDQNIDATSRVARVNGIERFLPTVAAGLSFNRTIDRWGVGTPDPLFAVDNYFTLGIQASIPLFDSNQRRISRQSSLIQEDQLRLDRENSATLIERSVRDVVHDLTNEMASIELSSVSEETARESLELAQASYATGAVTVVELLDAQTNYLQAQIARASATYTFLATSVAAQRLVGHFFLLSPDASNVEFLERFEAYAAQRAIGGAR